MNEQDPLATKRASLDVLSTTIEADTTTRGPLGELLDHLRSEIRQLDLRCCQLEILLNDLTIRFATPGAGESPRPQKRPRRDAAKPRKAA